MSKHTNPWTPTAERLRLLLDPSGPADDTMVTWLAITAAQAGHLDRLADLLHRTITRAMRDAGTVARQECLIAIQSIIDEVDGGRPPSSLERDQEVGDERRAAGQFPDYLLDDDTDGGES